MLKLDWKRIPELPLDLISKAALRTTNEMVARTKQEAILNVKRKFTLRNKWTVGSIRAYFAKRLHDRGYVGSLQDYMATQEFGGMSSRHIPTSSAAGQSMKQVPRTKVVRKANRIRNIRLKKRNGLNKLNRRQRNAAIFNMAKKGDYFLQNYDGRRAIMKKTGKTKARMMQRLLKRKEKVEARPWLRPAFEIIKKETQEIFEEQIIRQMRKRGIRPKRI